jgi:hypothetical protein
MNKDRRSDQPIEMMTTSDITVKLDDRVRLLSAVLAASRYPEQAQQRRPHGTHAHARATRKLLAPLQDHAAVQMTQTLLDQGAPLEALFTLVMAAHFPDMKVERPPRWLPNGWSDAMADFYTRANLAQWWREEDDAWQKPREDAARILEKAVFKPFLKPFVGEVTENFVFIPNISYPTDHEMGLRLVRDLVALIPPRLAWGDSPPWPYHEDPTHVYRAALAQYGYMLMMTYLRAHAAQVAEAAQTPLPVSDQFGLTWQEQFTSLFVAGAVAIYLEDHVSKAEADAYMLMERKVRGMTILPGVVSVLRRYLSELEAKRYQNLIDFLPVFPKQLRVAKKIVTL